MGFMPSVLIHTPRSTLHPGPHGSGALLSKEGHTSHPANTSQCPLVSMPHSESKEYPRNS